MSSLHLRKKISRSWGKCEEQGEVQLSDLNSGGHHVPAETGSAPSARVRVFGNQAVGMKAMQDATDFGALAFAITGLFGEMRGGLEADAQVTVGEAVQVVSAIHEGVE